LALAAGLFFGLGSTTSSLALPVRGQMIQSGGKFAAAPSDRFLVQSGDLCQVAITRTVGLLRQHPDIPTPLGFIQPAEQQIQTAGDIALSPDHCRSSKCRIYTDGSVVLVGLSFL